MTLHFRTLSKSRALLTALVVSVAAGGLPALAATIEFGPNGCSLSDAIESANTDTSFGQCAAGSGTDTLIAPDGWEITLGADLPPITSDLTLRTETAAGQLRLSGGGSRPILRVTGSGTDVNIQRVLFTLGKKQGAFNGGGAALNIRNASVSVVDSEFRANMVSSADGGAINIQDGVLSLRRTVVENNWTRRTGFAEKRGGGIFAKNSMVNLDEVYFHDNSSLQFSPEEAGTTLADGLFMDGGELVMDQSLVLERFRGIRTINGATVEISNSTIIDSAGGYRDIPKLDVQGPAFVALNHVTLDALISIRQAILEVTNSVIDECELIGTDWIINVANLYNLGRCNGSGPAPGLRALADNGGFTRTKAARLDAAVVDAGDPSYCAAVDQRGEPRGSVCDIGAFERSAVADLRLEAEIDPPGPWADGQEVRALLEVTNLGPDLANAVRLDADFKQIFSTASEASFCPGLPCTLNSIPVGGSVIVPVSAVMGGHFSGGFQVYANVGVTGASDYSDPDEGGPGGNNVIELSGTIAPGADLALDVDLLTAPPYFQGQNVSYQADIENLGGQAASVLELESIPFNLEELGFIGCDAVNGTICGINGLAAGQSTSITIQGKVVGTTFFLNGEVSAQELDLVPSNNIDDQGNQGAVSETDVSVEMTLVQSPPYYSDQFLQFEVVVRTGAQPASNVRVWSEFPGATSGFIDAGFCQGVFPCVISNMPANSSETASFGFFAPVTPDEGGAASWAHRIYAEPGQVDSDPGNNEAIIGFVYEAASDMVVNADLLTQGPYEEDDVVEYEIEMINGGVNQAENVTLLTKTDNLELVFVEANLCTKVNCSLAAMDFAQRERLLVQYRILNPGPFELAVSVASDQFDPNPGNNVDFKDGAIAAAALTDSILTGAFEADDQ